MKHSTPVPTDEDLNYEHPAPLKLINPNLKADKLYHLIMKEKLWKSWSGDSFGIYYHFEGSGGEKIPFEVDVKGKSMSLRDKMFIRDQDGNVLAVIMKMHLKWETTFKIYGFEPYVDGQDPSENQTYDDKPLYEWAKVKDNFFSVRKTMTTIDGIEYVMDGVGRLFDYRQMRLTRDGKVCAHMQEMNLGIFTGNTWGIRIGPGIDPCLIVGFMAINDEINEDQHNSN